MKVEKFTLIASIIFLVVGILHLLRIVFGWSFIIADWAVPYWLNVIAVVVLFYLSANGFRISRK